jgi:hypothetical protein
LILDESRWIRLSHSNGCNKCQLQKQKAIVLIFEGQQSS